MGAVSSAINEAASSAPSSLSVVTVKESGQIQTGPLLEHAVRTAFALPSNSLISPLRDEESALSGPSVETVPECQFQILESADQLSFQIKLVIQVPEFNASEDILSLA